MVIKLGIHSHGVVSTHVEFGFCLTWEQCFPYWYYRYAVTIEVRRLPYTTLDASIVCLREILLYGEWNNTWLAKDGLRIFLEFHLQLKVSQTAKLGFKDVWKRLTKFCTCCLKSFVCCKVIKHGIYSGWAV